MNDVPLQYRKRPVTISAMGPITSANISIVAKWCGSSTWDADTLRLVIDTLEGQMMATAGDYIIQGVQGEFYPCKPDIFAQTYEPITFPCQLSQEKA